LSGSGPSRGGLADFLGRSGLFRGGFLRRSGFFRGGFLRGSGFFRSGLGGSRLFRGGFLRRSGFGFFRVFVFAFPFEGSFISGIGVRGGGRNVGGEGGDGSVSGDDFFEEEVFEVASGVLGEGGPEEEEFKSVEVAILVDISLDVGLGDIVNVGEGLGRLYEQSPEGLEGLKDLAEANGNVFAVVEGVGDVVESVLGGQLTEGNVDGEGESGEIDGGSLFVASVDVFPDMAASLGINVSVDTEFLEFGSGDNTVVVGVELSEDSDLSVLPDGSVDV